MWGLELTFLESFGGLARSSSLPTHWPVFSFSYSPKSLLRKTPPPPATSLGRFLLSLNVPSSGELSLLVIDSDSFRDLLCIARITSVIKYMVNYWIQNVSLSRL